MFKISFLLLLLVIDTLYHRPNLIGYEKSRTINTKRSRAVGTRARIPHGEMHCFRMRRLALLLKAEGLSGRLVLQVHDELIVECPEAEGDRIAAILEEEMEQAVSLDVELVAEAHVGHSWADAH